MTVTLPHSGRALTTSDEEALTHALDRAWTLPSADDLAVLRELFPTVLDQEHGAGFADVGRDIHDGRTAQVIFSLGGVRLRMIDAARAEKLHERHVHRRIKLSATDAVFLNEDGSYPDWYARPAGTGVITRWSAKSRARMVETMASLDYRPLHDLHRQMGWTPGMVTFTYPGDWETVAGKGSDVKRHMHAFRERFHRQFGVPFVGVWKLEFQRRGAPHVHTFTAVPPIAPGAARRGRVCQIHYCGDCWCETFEAWACRTWADVVAHPDPVHRARHERAGVGVDFHACDTMTDARRLAVYFAGHSAKTTDGKEYQHVVPAAWQKPGTGPGRFWGYWGLSRPLVIATVTVQQWIRLRRVLRSVLRARDGLTAFQRHRWDLLGRGITRATATADAVRLGRRRTRRTLGYGGSMTGGFVLVNDAIRLGLDLASLA